MKVKIDCDRRLKQRGGTEYEGGWFYATINLNTNGFDMKCEQRYETYDKARTGAVLAGHEVDSAGWKKKLLMWNWHSHSLDGYPGWEIENPQEIEKHSRHPAYAKLEHINKRTKSSEELCNAWDDVAEVDFYRRDFSYDGSVFVRDGDAYGSGWWFATIAERDRFIQWAAEQMK